MVKEYACSAGDSGSISGSGRAPGEGNSNSPQCSSLENSMDCIVHGITKSETQLRDFHFSFSLINTLSLSLSLSLSQTHTHTHTHTHPEINWRWIKDLYKNHLVEIIDREKVRQCPVLLGQGQSCCKMSRVLGHLHLSPWYFENNTSRKGPARQVGSAVRGNWTHEIAIKCIWKPIKSE